MTIPLDTVRAIAAAVQNAGGDMTDVDDLVQTWERLHRDLQPRADHMCAQAQAVRCRCADGGQPDSTGRCERCCGRASQEAQA